MSTLRKIAYAILTAKDNTLKDQLDNIETIQHNPYEVNFAGENLTVERVGYRGQVHTYEEEFDTEIGGLPYLGDYDEGERFTGEQLRVLIAKEPDLVANVEQARRDNIGKIAELNKEVGRLINEMTQLAEEANVDVTINLGQHGSLDPNSDWDASRC
ncbi:hypothetical protein OC704_02540 [Sweet potato little leaf phytoplasma]|uniref:hypothetical protein n=1 Tax=Candidatus Phytoplasma australasiaticum TaxID=2754999 RepID=UPI0030E91F8F